MRLFLFILIFLQGSGLPPPGASNGHSDELQIQEMNAAKMGIPKLLMSLRRS